jgi:uncharacterized repeat protein (TIGR01451 family)
MATFVDFIPSPSISDSVCPVSETVHFEALNPAKNVLKPSPHHHPTWRDLGQHTVTLSPTFVDLASPACFTRPTRRTQPMPERVYAAYTNHLLEQHRKVWIDKLLQQFQAEITRLSLEFRQMARTLFQMGQRMATVGAKVALVGGLLLGAVTIPQHTARAAVMTVTNFTSTIANGDGCSLPEAIINANNNDQSGSTDCTSGYGPDTINLTGDVTLTAYYGYVYGAYTALPLVTSDITINGGGYAISGYDSFRVFAVDSGGTLTLNNIAVINGHVGGSDGGGIFNFGGTVNLNDSVLHHNNSNTGNAGGIFNSYRGTVNITDSALYYNEALGGDGGGIFNTDWSTVNVRGSYLVHNYAYGNGGGIFNTRYGSTVNVLDNSYLVYNFAMYGAGIANTNMGTVNVDNSQVSYNSAFIDGGGIFNTGNNSTLDVYNSRVYYNYAYVGGGIANRINGVATITGSQVYYNYAYIGGGIANYNSRAYITDSQIHDNVADHGGGIENTRGAVYITNDAVNNNYAYAFGGGIATQQNGLVDVTGGTLNGNQGVYGGGIANVYSRVYVTDTTLNNNRAIYGGGIFNAYGGQTELDNSTIASNRANYGGGIYSYDVGTALNIVDSLIQANRANYGGGIVSRQGASLTVTGSRLLNNRASDEGGAVWDDASGGTVIMTSCIVGNSDPGVFNPGTSGNQTYAYPGNWWGDVGGPGPVGPSVLGDTISNNVNFMPFSAVSILGCPTNIAPAASAPAGSNGDSGTPAISVFDPAISKLGFLLPGQVGVTGERIEWKVTVSNTGTGTGFNVQITDTLVTALQIDSVNAPGGTVSISGQTVTVTYASLAPGTTVNFSIFTTVLDGATVNNTVCVIDSTQPDSPECATALPVRTLPATGEIPLSDRSN